METYNVSRRKGMWQKQAPLLLLLLSLLSSIAQAQKLETITDFKLEYWRAFHGVIKESIKLPPDGGIALNAEVLPGMTEAEQKTGQKWKVEMLPRNGLDEILVFFNDPKVREFFATTKQKRQGDGSLLSITVTQNSFSLTFDSQDAFDKNAPSIAKEFGRLGMKLLRKAGIAIPQKELY